MRDLNAFARTCQLFAALVRGPRFVETAHLRLTRQIVSYGMFTRNVRRVLAGNKSHGLSVTYSSTKPGVVQYVDSWDRGERHGPFAHRQSDYTYEEGNYERGLLDGYYSISKWLSGVVDRHCCCYEHGRIEGWAIDTEEGELARLTRYQEGRIDGLSFGRGHYYWYRGAWEDGRREGCQYYCSDDTHFSSTRHERDRKEGVYYCWYDDGTLACLSYFEDGLLEGDLCKWYSNGRLASYARYRRGVRDGQHVIWYNNGRIAQWSYYEEGGRGAFRLEWPMEGGSARATFEGEP